MSDKQIMLPSLAGWYGAGDPNAKVDVMDGSRPRTLETKPLLVGEWPPKMGEGPHGPLSARPAWVLCAILGITYETFLCLFDRVNLLRYWRSESLPRVSSLRVMAEGIDLRGTPTILLGRRVAEAFGRSKENAGKFYIWGDVSGAGDVCPMVAIPHPGGRNLPYNQASERQQVREVLERALLYHGKTFNIGDYPNGNGSMIMVNGTVWGDAAKRLRHRGKRESQAYHGIGIGGYAIRKD